MLAALRTLLTDPDSFFADRAETLGVAEGLGTALLVSFLLTLVVGAGLFGLAQQLDGTVVVDNPDRPPEPYCETFNESAPGFDGNSTGCTAPKTVERDVGTLFWRAASGELPVLFVGVLVVWLGLALALYVAATLAGGRGSAGATAAVAAYGMVPSVLSALVAAALLVALAVRADLTVTSPESFLASVRGLVSGASGAALAAVQVGGVAWQVYVWTFGLAHVHDVPVRRAGGVAGLVGALLALGVVL